MTRKPKTEVEKLAEMARQPPWTNAALARAALRLARKDPAIGRALIAEVLLVGDDPQRMLKLEGEEKWFDMGGASALFVVERLEHELREAEDERKKQLLAAGHSELVRQEVESVASRALQIVADIDERSRQMEAFARLNQEALEHLALLLG